MKKELKTIEDVIGEFNDRMVRYKNDVARVPGRTETNADIEAYARKIYKEKYATVLHPYILDPYRVAYADEQAEEARAIKAHMDKVTKRRNNKN